MAAGIGGAAGPAATRELQPHAAPEPPSAVPALKRARTLSQSALGGGGAARSAGASTGAAPDAASEASPDDGSPAAMAPARLGHPVLDGCGRVDRFKKLNRIDEGTYGVVYRARDTETGEVIALKQLKLSAARSEDGFPISSMREISLLLGLDHPNVVRCREVAMGSSLNHIFMVMDYVEHELRVLIEKHQFSVAEAKRLLLQLLDGVGYLHDRWILHRDLKTSNTLLDNCGVLKVCDFGLARHYGDPLRPYTQRVVSLWYRAPELLLGQKKYSTSVDVWSIGCIFAEIFLRRPLFEGKVEVHQLGLIFKLTGAPVEETWPECGQLPNWRHVDYRMSLPRWRVVFPEEEGQLSELGLELLRDLLECCPARRTSTAAASEHPYFWEKPYPQEASMMPTFQESNCEGRRIGGSRVLRRGSSAVDFATRNALAGFAGAGLGAAPPVSGLPSFVKVRAAGGDAERPS